MKNLARIVGIVGILAFVLGMAMRAANIGRILNASPEGWWKASVALIAIAMFFALLHIADAVQKT